MYWAAASLGLAISVSKRDASLLARLPEVRALHGRALEIDESWNRGTLHELSITLAAAPGGGRDREAMSTSFERALWDRGVMRVAGVDEAGMSPLAGPVVAAAAIVPVGWRLARVDDSKKLDVATRESLAAQIREDAVAWAIGRAEMS